MKQSRSTRNRTSRLLSALFAAAVFVAPRWSIAEPFDRTDLQRIEHCVQNVAEKSLPAVVALTHVQGFGVASGTGTIITKDGIILTAAHVLAGAKSVEVIFPDGSTKTAEVLGADASRDVALAKIKEKGEFPFVEMGHSNDLKVGDQVVALGHAGGFDERRKAPVRFGRLYALNANGFLRSDCTLVGGDSGGPLFDLDGKVIGVHSNVGMDMTVNNDVPIDVARDEWKRLMAGDHWGKPMHGGMPPELPPAELAGLDVTKFRQKLMEEASKANGQLNADPDTMAKWLTECGMDGAHVKAMPPQKLAEFVGKVMGGGPMQGPPPQAPGNAEPADKPEAQKPQTQPGTQPVASATTRPATANGLPAELDMGKLMNRIAAEAQKSGGNLRITPADIATWFKEAGVPQSQLDHMSPKELGEMLAKAMGGIARIQGGPMGIPPEMKPIVDQDEAILVTIHPILEKVNPSVVTVNDGDHLLSLGTIVRADGFILAKLSEVAKAKSGLTVRLISGKSFPAKKVESFPEHDLALLKIAAKDLTAITLPPAGAELLAGTLVIAPSGSTASPMLAMGAVSVQTRSLRDSGGFLGVGLAEKNGSVILGAIEPKGPAEKAGLKKDDHLLDVDGKSVNSVAELRRQVRALKPGAVIKIKYRRGENEAAAELTLGDRAKRPLPPVGMEMRSPTDIGTQTSDVRTGFPMILQHDQPIRPQDCGGPIIDLNGDVVGLNIARAGRVNTYAIPSNLLGELLAKVKFDELEKAYAEDAGKSEK